MLRKKVNLPLGRVQFQKVNILIFFLIPICFFKEDLVSSVPARSLRKQKSVSPRAAFPAAGPGDRDACTLAFAQASSVPPSPSLYRVVGLPFLHPPPHSRREGRSGLRAEGLSHTRREGDLAWQLRRTTDPEGGSGVGCRESRKMHKLQRVVGNDPGVPSPHSFPR